MRKTLTYIEYTCFGIAVIGLFFILFLVGDTDMLAEPPTWVTTLLTCVTGFCAVLGAGIHWVGLPTDTKPSKKRKPVL